MIRILSAIALCLTACAVERDPVVLVVSPTLYDYAQAATEQVNFPAYIVVGHHRCAQCSWAYYDPAINEGARMTELNGYALIQIAPDIPYREITPILKEYITELYYNEVQYQLYPDAGY